MSKKIDNLKSQVLKILADFPRSRDSDQWLTIKLWCIFYPSRIKIDAEKKKYIYLTDIMEMPREDGVKRVRAIIQNEEKKFLPTTWEVAKQREINEEEWKNYIRNLKQ